MLVRQFNAKNLHGNRLPNKGY